MDKFITASNVVVVILLLVITYHIRGMYEVSVPNADRLVTPNPETK